MKVKVGKLYELELKDEKVLFAIMYAFEKGRNKDVYSLMVYSHKGAFEFPVRKETLNRWVKENKLKEVEAESALRQILG
ncbi:MAG: hypothetical protein J7L20_03240 [Thermoplasmata archaeon]|nr:hypothetical protein [Thermoplasmata archaeon]